MSRNQLDKPGRNRYNDFVMKSESKHIAVKMPTVHADACSRHFALNGPGAGISNDPERFSEAYYHPGHSDMEG